MFAQRNRGRRECRGCSRTRSLACEMKKHTSVVTTRTAVSPGIPYAMVLTGSFALSPVIGLVCHRHRRKLVFANLTPASRRQDHTTSPSATQCPRQKHQSRPPHPAPNVRDDREPPLLRERDGDRYAGDLGVAGTEKFLRRGLDS